jgi:sulfate/thiosulfate transport system substrate-binding protein
MRRRILVPLLAALAVLAAGVVAAGCGGSSSDASGSEGESGDLTLVAYSTPEAAHGDIIPAFNETPAGEGIGFEQSYGSSGEQSRAVEQGLAADVVHLSLEPDVTSLVEAGLVDADWNQDKTKGMVSNSVVVLMTRPGNPEDIQGWDDLTQEGIEVIAPNPITSGGARWNTMAAYGQVLEQGGSEEEGVQYLRDLFANITVQDTSARDSLETFTSGQGDVLIGYENEAIQAQQEGAEVDYVIPDQTILIENPAAVVNESDDPEAAQAFVDFMKTPESQEIFQEHGYRPIDEKLIDRKQFPEPPTLFTIDDLGGWDQVADEFFNEEDGIVTEIQRESGGPTE